MPAIVLPLGLLTPSPTLAASAVPAEKVTVYGDCYGFGWQPAPGKIRLTTRPSPNGTYVRTHVSGIRGRAWDGGIAINPNGAALNTPPPPRNGEFTQISNTPVVRADHVLAIYTNGRRDLCEAQIVRKPGRLLAFTGLLGVAVRWGANPSLRIVPSFAIEHRARYRFSVRISTPRGTQREVLRRTLVPGQAQAFRVPQLRRLPRFTRVKVTATKISSGDSTRLMLLRK